MNARAQAVLKQSTRAEPGTGFLYGWLLDNRPAPWVFYLSSGFMAATVLLVLFTDRRARSAAVKAAPGPAAA